MQDLAHDQLGSIPGGRSGLEHKTHTKKTNEKPNKEHPLETPSGEHDETSHNTKNGEGKRLGGAEVGQITVAPVLSDVNITVQQLVMMAYLYD